MKQFLVLAGFPAAILAQVGDGSFDFVQSLGSIGVGAILAVPFVVVWRIAMKRIRDLESEVKGLNENRILDMTARIAREKELSDAMAPLLSGAAEALRDTPSVFDRVIEKAQSVNQRNDADLRLRQIELAMDAILHKLNPGRDAE